MLSANSRMALPNIWASPARCTSACRCGSHRRRTARPRTDRRGSGLAHRKDRAVSARGDELLERREIAARLVALPLRRKNALRWSSDGQTSPSAGALRGRDFLDRREVRPGRPVSSRHRWAGRSRLPSAVQRRAGVREDVSRVVEHDVQDHVEPERVRRVDQRAQLFFRLAAAPTANRGSAAGNPGCRSRDRCGSTASSSARATARLRPRRGP